MANDSEQQQWWFNTKTMRVESADIGSPGKDLLGPYRTREEAERALERVRERNKEWDAQD
jgi:hypothetical protein